MTCFAKFVPALVAITLVSCAIVPQALGRTQAAQPAAPSASINVDEITRAAGTLPELRVAEYL